MNNKNYKIFKYSFLVTVLIIVILAIFLSLNAKVYKAEEIKYQEEKVTFEVYPTAYISNTSSSGKNNKNYLQSVYFFVDEKFNDRDIIRMSAKFDRANINIAILENSEYRNFYNEEDNFDQTTCFVYQDITSLDIYFIDLKTPGIVLNFILLEDLKAFELVDYSKEESPFEGANYYEFSYDLNKLKELAAKGNNTAKLFINLVNEYFGSFPNILIKKSLYNECKKYLKENKYDLSKNIVGRKAILTDDIHNFYYGNKKLIDNMPSYYFDEQNLMAITDLEKDKIINISNDNAEPIILKAYDKNKGWFEKFKDFGFRFPIFEDDYKIEQPIQNIDFKELEKNDLYLSEKYGINVNDTFNFRQLFNKNKNKKCYILHFATGIIKTEDLKIKEGYNFIHGRNFKIYDNKVVNTRTGEYKKLNSKKMIGETTDIYKNFNVIDLTFRYLLKNKPDENFLVNQTNKDISMTPGVIDDYVSSGKNKNILGIQDLKNNINKWINSNISSFFKKSKIGNIIGYSLIALYSILMLIIFIKVIFVISKKSKNKKVEKGDKNEDSI